MRRKPPGCLSKVSKSDWLKFEKEFEFSDAEYFLLEKMLQNADRWNEAEGIIKKHGLLLQDKKSGRVYANPAVAIQKDATTAVLRAWRQLGLKTPPPVPNIGRPPNSKKYFDDDGVF